MGLEGFDLDFLITIVRLPIGIVAGVTALIFWFVCFILETVIAIIALPFLAIFGKRTEVKDSWLSTYPNSSPISRTLGAWTKIAKWVLSDE